MRGAHALECPVFDFQDLCLDLLARPARFRRGTGALDSSRRTVARGEDETSQAPRFPPRAPPSGLVLRASGPAPHGGRVGCDAGVVGTCRGTIHRCRVSAPAASGVGGTPLLQCWTVSSDGPGE